MTLNKILKGIIITGIFSVFIIPFIVPSSLFFPFITGKGFFFRIMVEVIFAAWVLLTFRDAASRPKKSALLWAFVAFAVVMAAADMFGVNPWKSLWSNFERMEGYMTTIHLFLFFLVASSVVTTEKLWQRFLEWSLWSSLAMSLYGFMQLAGMYKINQGGVRVDGTFGNATYLAIFMVFNIFFALILIARDRKSAPSERRLWKPIVYGVIALFDAAILYYTATRGSILGLIGGLLLAALIVAIFDKGDRRIRRGAIWAVGAVIVLVVGFISVRNASFVRSSPVLARFASISWSEAGGEARAYIWPMAVKGWLQRPILGWGQENFNYIFNANYDPRMYSQEQWFDHAHNSVLDWLVSGGILGLAAYLALFIAALWLLWRKSDMEFLEKALFTGLFAGYFFHNLFVFDNIMSYILFVSLLGFIHWKSTRLEKPVAESADDMDDEDMKMAVPVMIVVLAFAIYFFNLRGYSTNTDLIGALQALNTQPVQYQAALDNFQGALSYDTLGRPEVVERLVEAASTMNTAAVPIDIRQKFAEMAKTAVDHQVAWFPHDARYELFAGTFYGVYGQTADAEKYLLAALSDSPKKQTIMFQLGSLYESTGQFDKAVALFKEAYDLEPSYGLAADNYAAALITAGRVAEARQFVATASSTADQTMTNDTYLRAFAAANDWKDVIAVLKARIAVSPNDMPLRQNLAAAYYQSGDKASAIQTARDMETIDPSVKAAAEQFIQAVQQGK